MATRTLRIGTRASALALWQANWVKTELEKKYPDLKVTLTKIKTQGDKILDVPLAMVGGMGVDLEFGGGIGFGSHGRDVVAIGAGDGVVGPGEGLFDEFS